MRFVPENKINEVFASLFAFFGTLGPEGLVMELGGFLFERMKVDPQVLVGQNFAETVFWQSSERNAAILVGALDEARRGNAGTVPLDFRISASKKIAVEFSYFPIADETGLITHIFFCAAEKGVASLNDKRGRIATDSFLAVVSHELRSPLNAILGWAKILNRQDLDAETRSKALETIEKSARSQAKLLDDLLDSSRVASGRIKLEYRETDLNEIITTACNLQKPAADFKRIELKITLQDGLIKVFADAMRLQQVISNLLSNSIKFTPESGKVEVEVRADAENAVIKVVDDGLGISRETLPMIFDQFRQGDDDQSGRFGGLGLGLSIAKILVEKHKGSIIAESAGRGRGSTFTVRLPLLQKGTRDDDPLRPEQAIGLKNLRILIVEDMADSREMLRAFLAQNGAIVNTAESAKQALDLLLALEYELPDVILSDLGMPGEDGISLIKSVRALPKEKGGAIPALAVSAFTDAENREKAIEAGFQKYHTKPFQSERLIREILELARQT